MSVLTRRLGKSRRRENRWQFVAASTVIKALKVRHEQGFIPVFNYDLGW